VGRIARHKGGGIDAPGRAEEGEGKRTSRDRTAEPSILRREGTRVTGKDPQQGGGQNTTEKSSFVKNRGRRSGGGERLNKGRDLSTNARPKKEGLKA